MDTKKLSIAAGAVALILAGSSGGEASENSRAKKFGAFAHPAHAQAGGANLARTGQRGNRNASAIQQTGSGNIARITQRGDDNEAGIVQTGDYNRGRIIQIGDGLSASQYQDGGERSNIIQVNRGNASVSIQTGQGGQKSAGSGSGRPGRGRPFN